VAIANPPAGAGIKRVAVIGAGLAGLACASALARRGFRVHVLERKSIPGGRASSYEAQDTGEVVDNCQHILMGCCTNLLRFYEDSGVGDRIRWVDRFHFLEPNGRESVLRGSRLPAPFHLLPSFFRLGFLGRADKWAVARALMRMLAGPGPRADGPMLAWLRAAGQTHRAIERFWGPILVSALNEEPERCSTRHAFQIFRQGFLAHPRAYVMGIPRVPLRDLYGPCVERLRAAGCEVTYRAPVRGVAVEAGRAAGVALEGETLPADYVVSAAAFDGVAALLPEAWRGHAFFRGWEGIEPSPISAVHLWWDRPVTAMQHAALLDRQVQWMFNKTGDFGRADAGTYMGLVVSASRDWLRRSRGEILEIAEREVRESFPETAGARVEKSAVIKEAKATFSPTPGVDALRPPPETPLPGFFLAGDWVRTGWPSTMEGAVRGGYLAAERILAAEGRPELLLAPDLPATPLLRG